MFLNCIADVVLEATAVHVNSHNLSIWTGGKTEFPHDLLMIMDHSKGPYRGKNLASRTRMESQLDRGLAAGRLRDLARGCEVPAFWEDVQRWMVAA